MTESVRPIQVPSRTPWEQHRWPVLAGVLAISLLLVGMVVLPQLSPRVSGTQVQLRVAPVDPIDPFRGAYVDLSYPDLPDRSLDTGAEDEERGTAFVPLTQRGEVWVGGRIQRTAPDGVFLRCDDSDWRLRCGIESWFTDQSEALAIEQQMTRDGAIATVRVDRWGNAALLALEPAGE